MAFTQSTFLPRSSVANSNAPRVYHYKTSDAIATVAAADYFLDAYQVLDADDRIVVFDDTSGSLFSEELIVTAATASTVTVSRKTSQVITTTTAGTATPGVQFIEINNTAAAAVTIASSLNHVDGVFGIKQTGASTAGAAVTLTAGTWDGTNSVATTNAANEALFVKFDSSGDGSIVENVGSVALS